jgi:hypothetical protein
MLFPDREQDRIAALGAASTEAAGTIVRKSVVRIGATPGGGVDMLVGIGPKVLAVGLHTRASLPHLSPPSLTVLAHSPEFVPSHADGEFHALARHLGAAA